jgi:hypothetical protein
VAVTAQTIERQLMQDLRTLGDRFADEKLSTELYRALARNAWRKQAGPEGHVALSFGRAEEIVNELRAGHGQPAIEMGQSGGEGEVSRTVETELGRLGWTAQPLNTTRHDDAHLARPASPPPRGHGERMAPVEDPHAWEREAHEEAERSRRPA